jgi:hypothetical protein
MTAIEPHVEPERTTPCPRKCGNTYERGYVSYYKNNKLVESVCENCATKDRNDEYKKTKEITTRLWMDASLDRERLHSKGSLKAEEHRVDSMDADEILRSMRACDELIGEFRRRHWMGGLCKRVYEAKYGLSGKTKDFKVMILASAGRVLITIQDTKPKGKGKFGGANITLITADGDVAARLGVQGIYATKEEAIGLLWHVVYKLPKLKADSKVSFGF